MHRSGQVEFNQALLASPGNPVNGEINNSIANVTARLPWQGVSSNSLQTNSVFVGNYNALQASIRHRLQHGLELQASYTWSKNLDEVNGEAGTDIFELQLPTNDQRNLRHSSYGPAGGDRGQRLVADFSWTTPRQAFGPSFVRSLLSPWQFSGVGVIQSGIPLSVFDTNAGSVYGLISGEVRGQRTGSSPYTHGSTARSSCGLKFARTRMCRVIVPAILGEKPSGALWHREQFSAKTRSPSSSPLSARVARLGFLSCLDSCFVP